MVIRSRETLLYSPNKIAKFLFSMETIYCGLTHLECLYLMSIHKICIHGKIYWPVHKITILMASASREGSGDDAQTPQSLCCSYTRSRFIRY